MYSSISTDFTTSLVGIVGDDVLKIINDKLTVFLSDYDIKKKCTSVTEYNYEVPKEVVKYIALSKINGLSKATIKKYYDTLSTFFTSIRKDVSDVTSDDIIIFLVNYEQAHGISKHTMNQYRTIIHGFFEYCVLDDVIIKNPCKKIRPIKYKIHKEEALDEYTIEKIRSKCKSKRNVAIIDFFLSTGCRVSELTSINVSDIDFRNCEVNIIGKGNKKRTLYISGKAMHSLEEYLHSRPDKNSDVLFSSCRYPYDRIGKNNIEKMVRGLGTDCNIEKLHPHLFRKTFATQLYRRGMSLAHIQYLLGHENISTTMRYLDIKQDDIKSEHGRLIA